LRFAVHRPDAPAAAPRRHDVPRRDIPGRIHIGIADVSTGGAPEDGSALARSPVHQQTPAGSPDLVGEPRLLTDIPTWILTHSSDRTGHLRDRQVFHADDIEPPRNPGAGLLCPVLAPVRLASAQAHEGKPHPPATSRATLRAGKPALQSPQSASLSRGEGRRMQQLTGRQSRGYHHAPIETNDLASAWPLNRHPNRGEGTMPPPGPVTGHSVGPSSRGNRTGPAEPYPANLRDPYLTDAAGQATRVPLPTSLAYDPEPLVSAGLTSRWTTMSASDISGEVKRRPLVARAGVSTPRIP